MEMHYATILEALADRLAGGAMRVSAYEDLLARTPACRSRLRPFIP